MDTWFCFRNLWQTTEQLKSAERSLEERKKEISELESVVRRAEAELKELSKRSPTIDLNEKVAVSQETILGIQNFLSKFTST